MRVHQRIRHSLGVAFLLACGFLSTTVSGQSATLTASDANGLSGDSVTSTVLLDTVAVDIRGWSYGVCHDVAQVSLTGVTSGATTAVVQAGAPPDYESIDIYATGFTHAVVICFSGCAVLAPGTGHELVDATYTLLGTPPSSSTLCFCGDLGLPPVEVVLVDSLAVGLVPTQACGTLTVGSPEQSFIRGDSNGDGIVDVADAISTIQYQFQGGTANCLDASNANDDASVDIGDVIWTLVYIFNDGPPPPPPFPLCGFDTTLDSLDCALYTPCP